MATVVRVPVKNIKGTEWADLSSNYPSSTHIICATDVRMGEDIALYHNHGLRSRKFKHNVHWRVMTGFDIDITNVPTLPASPAGAPAAPPQRAGRRHHKG